MERFIERFRYKATKARQAQSRVKRLDKMERIERDPRDNRSLGFSFGTAERSRPGRARARGRPARGARTHAARGRRALARARRARVAGGTQRRRQDDPDRRARRPPRAGRRAPPDAATTSSLGYLSQHAEELGSSGTVLDAAQRATGLTPNKARALLGRFLFSGEEVEKPLDGLSGGERRRLSLAILVSSGANVLILDEPTNHLDLDAREALEDALSSFEGSRPARLARPGAARRGRAPARSRSRTARLRSYEGGWAEYSRLREERRLAEAGARDQARSERAAAAAPARRRRQRRQAERDARRPVEEPAAPDRRPRARRRARGEGPGRRSRTSWPIRPTGSARRAASARRNATPRPSAPSSRRTRPGSRRRAESVARGAARQTPSSLP